MFLQRPARVSCAFEDSVPIGVDGEWQARAESELAEDLEVAVSGFLGVEPPGEHVAGGIINERMQDECGAALLQPGVVAAVALDEHPRLGHALAPVAMTRCARRVRGLWMPAARRMRWRVGRETKRSSRSFRSSLRCWKFTPA